MGNRAIVHFPDINSDGEDNGVCVYLHWNADDVKGWLKAAAPDMRAADPSYAAARFVAYCANNIPGGLSVGIHPGEFAHDPENGLYRVDCSTGRVTLFREGRNGELARSGRPFSIKLGKF